MFKEKCIHLIHFNISAVITNSRERKKQNVLQSATRQSNAGQFNQKQKKQKLLTKDHFINITKRFFHNFVIKKNI